MKKKIRKAVCLMGLALTMSGMAAGSCFAGAWAKDNRGWWYDNGDGTYPAASWQWIDGMWYCFDGSGYMRTGWIDSTYYCSESGAMVTGWYEIAGDWYYFSGDGSKVTNQWVGDYYLLSSGKMATDRWIDGYWVDSDGKWDPNYDEDEDSYTYSSSSSSSSEKGSGSSGNSSNNAGDYGSTNQIGNNTSTQGSNTSAASNEEVKETVLNGWVSENGDWYYYENGERVKQHLVRSGSYWYYVDGSGKLLKNSTVTINGVEYQLDSNGIAREKEEEKAQSTLSINGHSRVVSHTIGDDFSMDGVISSNYKINYIRILIKASSGSAKVYEKIFNPNANEFDLSTLLINSADVSKIKNYTKVIFTVQAEDESGASVSVINDTIEVKRAEAVKVEISGKTTPSRVSYGCNFGLYGVITCNYEMNEVEGRICKKASGADVIMRKEVYPNSKTYDLHGPINDALIFENLEKGTYYYIVTVKANGVTKEIIKKAFVVL